MMNKLMKPNPTCKTIAALCQAPCKAPRPTMEFVAQTTVRTSWFALRSSALSLGVFGGFLPGQRQPNSVRYSAHPHIVICAINWNRFYWCESSERTNLLTILNIVYSDHSLIIQFHHLISSNLILSAHTSKLDLRFRSADRPKRFATYSCCVYEQNLLKLGP